MYENLLKTLAFRLQVWERMFLFVLIIWSLYQLCRIGIYAFWWFHLIVFFVRPRPCSRVAVWSCDRTACNPQRGGGSISWNVTVLHPTQYSQLYHSLATTKTERTRQPISEMRLINLNIIFTLCYLLLSSNFKVKSSVY